MNREAATPVEEAVEELAPQGRFRPFPEYQDSGVEWLGEAPTHWKVRKLKFVASLRFSNVDKKSHDDEPPVRLCNYTDVYYNEHITSAVAFMDATASTDEIERFSLKRGDVLITKDSEDRNDIAVSTCVVDDLEGVLCGYHLAQVRPHPSTAHGPYLARAFAASGIRDQFNVAATGITRYGLSKDTIGSSLFLVPPLGEQRSIAAFLDRETARIDELIAKKQRLIELLAEKRTALISHAVTKGLNPDAPMKDSGIEWFGDIPNHWEITRLGWVSIEVSDINHEMPTSAASGVAFLSAKDLLDDGTLNFSHAIKRISEDDFERLSRKSRPRRGDIIYSRIGACLGKARLVEVDERFLVSYSCCLVRMNPSVANRKFFRHLLDAEMVLTEAMMRTQGIGVPDLGLSEICRFPVPLPPVEEQREIADYLDDKEATLRLLSKRVNDGLEQLREYRSALVSAAVTGKIDVREDHDAE